MAGRRGRSRRSTVPVYAVERPDRRRPRLLAALDRPVIGTIALLGPSGVGQVDARERAGRRAPCRTPARPRLATAGPPHHDRRRAGRSARRRAGCIDTPGLRAVSLWSQRRRARARRSQDVFDLAERCRFARLQARGTSPVARCGRPWPPAASTPRRVAEPDPPRRPNEAALEEEQRERERATDRRGVRKRGGAGAEASLPCGRRVYVPTMDFAFSRSLPGVPSPPRSPSWTSASTRTRRRYEERDRGFAAIRTTSRR